MDELWVIGACLLVAVVVACISRWRWKRRVAIYVLTDPVSGEVRYVGKSVDPYRRLGQHMRDRSAYGTDKQRWMHGLWMQGQAPQMWVIQRVPSNRQNQAEREWIARYQAQGARLVNTVHNRKRAAPRAARPVPAGSVVFEPEPTDYIRWPG
jgi:hypothetical protein